MSNTLYLDETLTGFEREFAIESAKTDIAFQKLDALYEAVDATLKANYMEAELKVYAENGTYDDLATLYTEAESEASEKKGSIIGSMLKALGVFFDKLKKAIMSIFKKKDSYIFMLQYFPQVIVKEQEKCFKLQHLIWIK